MVTKLHSIYDSVYQNPETKEPHEFISLVEPEIREIEGFNSNDHEEYEKATRLISDYALMLFKVGAHGKSIPWLNKGVQLFQNDSKLTGKHLLSESMYEALVASRGVSMYSMRKLKRAQEDFMLLHREIPNNQSYVQWLRKTIGKRFQRLAFPFYGLITAGIVISLIEEGAKGYVNYLTIGLIVIGLVGSTILEIQKRKKMKTLPNNR